jgi:probable rRNA maturation factor
METVRFEATWRAETALPFSMSPGSSSLMKPDIAFAFESPKSLPVSPAKFRRDAAKAVAAAGFEGRLSLAVVSDETMRRVNRDFHACDEPTDVLAFPLAATSEDSFDAEVIVSLDTARREAAAHGVEPAAELMLYVVHGVLHLSGYDDHALADARRMHARALSILEGLGHRNTIRPRSKPKGRRRGSRGSRP